MPTIGNRFELFVPGRPVPQGSKTAFVSKSTGRPIVVDKDTRLPVWRAKITAAALGKRNGGPTLAGAVGIKVIFVLDRPKTHYGTGRFANRVKDSSPKYPATMPDIDKLLRAIFDALTDAQVVIDDAQFVWVQTAKRYPDVTFDQQGVYITLGVIR